MLRRLLTPEKTDFFSDLQHSATIGPFVWIGAVPNTGFDAA